MRFTFIAPGSRGDIQPYVALGVGLVAAGHAVRIVTTVDHTELVASYGLELCPVDVDVRAELQADAVSASLESGSHLRSFWQIAKIAARMAERMAHVGLEACEGADAIVTGFGGVFMAEAFAVRLGVPLVQAYNVPLTPTSAFPGALAPGLSFGPRSRWLSQVLTRQGVWMLLRSSGNAPRKKVLGMPSAPLFASSQRAGFAPGPVLYGHSPAFLPHAPEWGDDVEVTGYWFADEPRDFSPPPGLDDFLAAGEKPVCIGFGSMSQRDPAATTRLVLDAVARSGKRAILLSNWGGLRASERPETIFQVESIPHAWLYPRVSAIVHHGGAGTTAAALRAGVPAIVVPFHGDQFFWANLVHERGVGPAPVPRTRLTAERLAEALVRATEDAPMAARSAALGARIREEKGISRAIAAIERIAGGARHAAAASASSTPSR